MEARDFDALCAYIKNSEELIVVNAVVIRCGSPQEAKDRQLELMQRGYEVGILKQPTAIDLYVRRTRG